MQKGFTLVEVLVVLIILGILIILTMPGYIDVLNNSKRTSLNSKINEIETVALDYAENIKDDIKNADSCTVITISDLIKRGLISSESNTLDVIYNPADNTVLSGNIELCYCTSTYDVEAYYVNEYDSSKSYYKKDKIIRDNIIYICTNKYPGYIEEGKSFEDYFSEVTC